MLNAPANVSKRYSDNLERLYLMEAEKPNLGSVVITVGESTHEFQVDTVDRICQLMNRAYVAGHTAKREPLKTNNDTRGVRHD